MIGESWHKIIPPLSFRVEISSQNQDVMSGVIRVILSVVYCVAEGTNVLKRKMGFAQLPERF